MEFARIKRKRLFVLGFALLAATRAINLYPHPAFAHDGAGVDELATVLPDAARHLLACLLSQMLAQGQVPGDGRRIDDKHL